MRRLELTKAARGGAAPLPCLDLTGTPPLSGGRDAKSVSISCPWSEVETAFFGIGCEENKSRGHDVDAPRGAGIAKFHILEVDSRCDGTWNCSDMRVEAKPRCMRQQKPVFKGRRPVKDTVEDEKTDGMATSREDDNGPTEAGLEEEELAEDQPDEASTACPRRQAQQPTLNQVILAEPFIFPARIFLQDAMALAVVCP